ncbi:MAG: S-layer homology domain-containing protein [Spirulina sp.]
MPSLPGFKRRSARLQPKFALAVLIMGVAAGITGGFWQRQRQHPSNQTHLNSDLPGDHPVDQVTVPGFPNPLRLLASLRVRPAPPLEIPPPPMLQPLSPQEVWPSNPSQSPRPSFNDLDLAPWAAPILEDLAQRRFIKGFPDGTFRPNDPMSRAEFAAQLSRLFVLTPQELRPTAYTDVDANHWAVPHIQAAVEQGFLTGYPDGTFRPDEAVTRLQVMLALANGLNLKSSSSPDRVLRDYLDTDQVPAWAKPALIATLEANLVTRYPQVKRLEPNRNASRAEVVAMLRQTLVYTGQLSPLPPGFVPPPDQPAY